MWYVVMLIVVNIAGCWEYILWNPFELCIVYAVETLM